MLDSLRQLHTHGCIVRHCSKENVTLNLPRSGCVCVDCDDCPSFMQDESKPDYIGIKEGSSSSQANWFVVEMKTNVSSVSAVLGQIEAGVDKIRSSPSFQFSGATSKVIGIVVHSRRGAKTADLARHKMTLRGEKVVVIGKRSGSSL